MPAELLRQESQRLVLAMTERVMFLQAHLSGNTWPRCGFRLNMQMTLPSRIACSAGLGPGPGEQPAIRSRTPAESGPPLLPKQPPLRSAYPAEGSTGRMTSNPCACSC